MIGYTETVRHDDSILEVALTTLVNNPWTPKSEWSMKTYTGNVYLRGILEEAKFKTSSTGCMLTYTRQSKAEMQKNN